MTVIVIGAGATRGASFVDETSGGCLPPLDADFFTQLQRIATPKHQSTITSVIRAATRLFGLNFRVTLEGMFTVLEHLVKMGGAIGRKSSELGQERIALLQGIAAVLEESLTEGRELRECDFHSRIVKRLKDRDTIISFNYDCLIDHSLRKHGDGKWNPRYGYCLPIPRGRGGSIGESPWQPGTPSSGKQTIRLLKLHGSANFRRVSDAQFRLKQRPYTRQRGNLKFEIIPPESVKRFDEGVFGKLWRRAARELHRATSLVVVGYSFPLSDQHTSALFRLAIRAHALKKVCIVNRDPEARRRAREIVKPGLAEDARVLSFDSLEAFASARPKLWR